MNFKPGDIVRILSTCSGTRRDETGVLQYGNINKDNMEKLYAITPNCRHEGGDNGCSCHHNWVLISSTITKPFLQTI